MFKSLVTAEGLSGNDVRIVIICNHRPPRRFRDDDCLSLAQMRSGARGLSFCESKLNESRSDLIEKVLPFSGYRDRPHEYRVQSALRSFGCVDNSLNSFRITRTYELVRLAKYLVRDGLSHLGVVNKELRVLFSQ
jgi:hypothetical protein